MGARAFCVVRFIVASVYICVPNTWIFLECGGGSKRVLVYYPRFAHPAITKERARRREPPCGDDWGLYEGDKEYETDTFEDAERWIMWKICNGRTQEDNSGVRDSQLQAGPDGQLRSGSRNLPSNSGTVTHLIGVPYGNRWPEIAMKRPVQAVKNEESAEKRSKPNEAAMYACGIVNTPEFYKLFQLENMQLTAPAQDIRRSYPNVQSTEQSTSFQAYGNCGSQYQHSQSHELQYLPVPVENLERTMTAQDLLRSPHNASTSSQSQIKCSQLLRDQRIQAKMKRQLFGQNDIEITAVPQYTSEEPTPATPSYVIPPTRSSDRPQVAQLTSFYKNPVYQNPRMKKMVVDNSRQTETNEHLMEGPLSPPDSDVASSEVGPDHEISIKEEHAAEIFNENNGCAEENQTFSIIVAKKQILNDFFTQMGAAMSYAEDINNNLSKSYRESGEMHETSQNSKKLIEALKSMKEMSNSINTESTSTNTTRKVPQVNEDRRHGDEERPNAVTDGENHNYRDDETPRTARGGRHKLVLPPEYDPNDSKWTLRYRGPGPGLVELQPGTGIYVRYKKLVEILRESSCCVKLARLLFEEIFNERALSVCSYAGHRMLVNSRRKRKLFEDARPGLDRDARLALDEFVREYGLSNGWDEFNSVKVHQALYNTLAFIRNKYREKVGSALAPRLARLGGGSPVPGEMHETSQNSKKLIEALKSMKEMSNSINTEATSTNTTRNVPQVTEDRRHGDEERPNAVTDGENHNYRDDETPRTARGGRHKLVLPPEYDPNDSKWTLRYRGPGPGLVELQPGTGIYVRYKKLVEFLRNKSSDCVKLARLLFKEIFNERALSVCSYAGHEMLVNSRLKRNLYEDARPGLDRDARMALDAFVREYGPSNGWEEFNSVKVHQACINTLAYMRKKY